MSAPAIPLADQIAEIERELSMRERVYASWIASGRLKREVADERTARLRAARDTLRNLAACP